jgi:hypothetical protein
MGRQSLSVEAHSGQPGTGRSRTGVYTPYELYLQRGASDGRDTDDWLEAEREVVHSFDRSSGQ